MNRRAQPEYELHCRVADYLAKHPAVGMFHSSPNGAKLHGSKEQRARTGKRLKRVGMVPGYPDITLYTSNGRVGHLELKADKGRLSDSQIEVKKRMAALGHHYDIARSIDDVDAALAAWGWS